MVYLYAGHVLKRFTNLVKSVIATRLWRRLFMTIIIVIVLLYMLLPLNRPVIFGTNTEIRRIHNGSKYIHKYPGTYRRRKLQYKILPWTKLFQTDWGKLNPSVFSGCQFSNCVMTYNKSDIHNVDALLFHPQDMFYFFWLPTSFYIPLPNYRTREQVWLLVTQEPPINVLMDYKRYNSVFNWTATYRQTSDVYIPYGRFIKRTTKDAVRNVDDVKRSGVVWVAGNCIDHARRRIIINELEKYIRVDKFGFCGKGEISHEALKQRHYKFYLSFENSICDDYVTEKFFERLNEGMLPVVLGGVDYKKFVPPHSYIDISDFNSAKEVAAYLNYLEQNDTAYKEYFEWTKEYEITFLSRWCSICEALNSHKSHQVYTDLDGWFRNDICHQLSEMTLRSKYCCFQSNGTSTTESSIPFTDSTPNSNTSPSSELPSGSTMPMSGSTNPDTGSTNPNTGSTSPNTGSTSPNTGSTNPDTKPTMTMTTPASSAPVMVPLPRVITIAVMMLLKFVL